MKRQWLLIVIALIYAPVAMSWEDWEQRLIDQNCHQYEEQSIDQNYLRCLRVDLTNIDGGKVDLVSAAPESVLGCASNKENRWCDVTLVKSNRAILTITIDKIDKQNNAIVLNENNLGDKCSCKVSQWAIETDNGFFRENGVWYGKAAFPVINTIRKSQNLSIYAEIPNEYKQKYRADFKSSDIVQFKKDISRALDFVFQQGKYK